MIEQPQDHEAVDNAGGAPVGAPELVFDQVNLLVADIDASARFYRYLGADVPEVGAGWPPGSTARHLAIEMPNGARLELDNVEMARIWYPGWHAAGPGGRVVVGFSHPTSEAVDEAYLAATAAGYPGRQPPYDAFWGSRYAIVADPDGNHVGLMGPVDPARRYVPEVTS